MGLNNLPEFEGEKDVKLGPGPDANLLDLPGKSPDEVIVCRPGTGDTLKDASQLVAHSLATMLAAGMSRAEIREADPGLLAAYREDNKAQRILKAKVKDYRLNAEELKDLVKTKLTEMALDETKDDKVQLDAIKQIASMPEVGLSGSYAKVQVNIANISAEASSVLDRLGDE